MRHFPLSLLLLCLAAVPAAAQTPGPRAFSPELYQKIQQLRQEIQASGLQFQVDVNPAMQYDPGRLCGTRIELMPPEFLAHEPGGYENYQVQEDVPALPRSYVGVFSNPKDQGQCGSCWAFSTIGSLEGAALKQAGAPNGQVNADGSITCSGTLPALSEEQVLSCNPWGWACNGGYFAFDMLMPSKVGRKGYYPGAVPAISFPYVGDTVACRIARNATYTPVTQWGFVASGNAVPPVAAVKQAILKYGGVSACVYADRYLPRLLGRRVQRHHLLQLHQPRHRPGGLGRRQGCLAAEEQLGPILGDRRVHVDQVRHLQRRAGRLLGDGLTRARTQGTLAPGGRPHGMMPGNCCIN